MDNVSFHELLLQFSSATDEKEKNKYFEEFFRLFEPLLKKYAYKLGELDNKYFLGEELYNALLKMPCNLARFKEDKYIVSYIHKAIYSEYLKLSKKNKTLNNEVLFDDGLLCNKKEDSPFEQFQFNELLRIIYSVLTEEEQKYFYLKFICDYSQVEIAKIEHVSRQAVNKRMKNIIKKITLAIK